MSPPPVRPRCRGRAGQWGARAGLLAWIVLSGPTACAVPARADDAAFARLDSLLAAEARAGFSGWVLIGRGDDIRYQRAYGTALRVGTHDGLPAFWLASCSKQITATAILRLQESGRLRVSDSLGRFFSGVPPDKRAITVHQLLTHTSGLPSAYRADGILERDQAVAAILGLRLDSAPGAKHAYSNDGYVLLAAIAEIAAGVPYDAFVRDSLFARAGLSHAGLWGHELPGTLIAPVADPKRTRSMRPTIYREGRSVANWGYRGPTGVFATAHDVHAWIGALRSGRIMGATSLRALVGRHVLVRGDSTGQSYAAYGWGVRVEDGRDVSYGHTGGEDWLGHTSVVRFTPAGDVVVVLANSGEVDGVSWATRVNRGLRRVLDGR